MMKNSQQTLLFDGINEDAYLSKKEEDRLVELACETVEKQNMSFEEQKQYFKNFPMIRMFASAYIDLNGTEEYKKLEERNIKIITTRAWEK